MVDHKVAVVGMAPVVNKEVGVKDISKQDLIDIFTGKTKNWSELGGKDQEIAVINRASGSGTRATFENGDLTGPKQFKPKNKTLLERFAKSLQKHQEQSAILLYLIWMILYKH